MRLTYRKLVLRKAYELFRTRLLSRGRQVMGFIVQTTIVFAILYYQPWVGSFQEQGRLVAAGVVSVLLSVGLSFLWDLFRAPEIIWHELSERVETLERIIRPKFSVLTDRRNLRDFNYGHVSRSAGGQMWIISTRSPANLLVLDVRNETAATLTRCEAYLSHFWEIGGEDAAFQSMRLQWVAVADEIFTVDIPSSGLRTAIVFRLFGNRVGFIHDDVPNEQLLLLKENGHYAGVVALTAQNTATGYVGFELQCIPDSAPHFRLLRRGFDDVELVPWVKETMSGLGF
jgi:hypothetical protein